MKLRSLQSLAATLAITLVLAACTTMPAPTVKREADVQRAPEAGAPAGTITTVDGRVVVEPLPPDARDQTPQARIRRGTGQVLNQSVASQPPPGIGGSGAATFNFEGESLHAVVKAILGDMLGQNYVIAPGVQGTVTLATPRPVSAAQALSLLEQILAWNNARMVWADGRYNIVPADQALAGTVAPRTGPAAMARGFEVRAVPLRYISATEMEKLLKPYARPNAIVSVDGGRNIITVAGTRAELENYLRTIQTFDVDWMSSMSVGVFPLENGRAARVVADLERVFGESSKSPVAGMFRFLPLEGANAILVITPQPRYLDEIAQWLQRIDGAGEGVTLHSYELKYIKAKDLAERLADVFGGGRSGAGGASSGTASLMPGTTPTEINDSGVDGKPGESNAMIGADGAGGGASGTGGTGGGLGNGQLALPPAQGGNAAVTLQVDGDRVGVSAVDETNTLLVRSTASAWRSIREVIERLDVMPMQVQIEAQVAEVKLSGDLQYGVNWFFENAVTQNGLPDAHGRSIWGDIAGSITQPSLGNLGGISWTFLGRNAAAVISALDQVTDVRLLSTPSVLVRNNKEAILNVGSRIPIASVTVNPNGGQQPTTYSQVQYLDTGTILKVRPRITKDGMVFLDIVQEVSSPGSIADADINGNVRIDNRRVKTEAAVQSGDTIMLAGLIEDGVTRGSSGVPILGRIPVIGSLFGRQTNSTRRSEVIVLITPTIVRNPMDARNLTDEYSRRFRAMEPLRATPRQR